MSSFLDRLKNEPAVVIGILAAAALAVVSSLQGNGIIDPDVGTTIEKALSPDGGWAIPIIVGIVTRFFVYGPKSAEQLKAEVPEGYVLAPVPVKRA